MRCYRRLLNISYKVHVTNEEVRRKIQAAIGEYERSFPGADIGSDHDLAIMTFRVLLKKARKPNQPRLRFDLEKLRDPDVACTFQANDR